MLLQNSFEGGTNNTAITTANSGGASGTAFTYTEGARYTNAQAAAGSLSATGLGNKTPFVLSWEGLLSGNGDRYGHIKFRLTKPTSDISWALVGLSNNGYTHNWGAWANVDTDGSTWLELSFAGTVLASEEVEIPLGTWCRLELRADNNSPTSTAELRFYDQVDASVPAATLTASHANAVVSAWYDAYVTLGTPDPVTNAWVDDVACSDEDWIGPSAINAEVTPGPVTGAAVIPAPAVSLGATLTPGPVTGTAVIPTPEIYTGAPVTAIAPAPVIGTAVIPAPTVDAYKNIALTPAPVVAEAVIPAPAVTVPINPGDSITQPGQIEWNGFLLGSQTPYRWLSLEGWVTELPTLDSGNVAQPGRHGSYPGRDLAQERHVTWTARIRAPREDMQAVIDDLIAATRVLDDDTELPLAIRMLDTTLVGYGKIARRAIPVDKLVRLGHAQLTIQWTLSDPILQSRELASAVLQDGAWQTVVNLGNAPASPTIRILGPCQDPAIVIRHENAGRVTERWAQFNIGLDTGTLLVVDTYHGTAMIGDAPVMHTLDEGSVPIPDLILPSGVSEVGYASSGGGAPAATMLWRHSYL